MCAAPRGNKFWKDRAKSGRNKMFSSPDDLWDSAVNYFEWIEDNPLLKEKLFSYQRKVITGTVKKMRPMSINGLCQHLGISRRTWGLYKSREDFMPVTMRVEMIIWVQQFSGAASGLFNANIIARKLAQGN